MAAPARADRMPGPSGVDSAFARDVVAGLTARPKSLPPKYFYDAAGSELFERITEQPEYYPARTERRILEENAGRIAKLLPENAALVEFGSGSSVKTRIVLRAAPHLSAYVPLDIASDFVSDEARRLREEFPRLRVIPVVADFFEDVTLPLPVTELPLIGLFPGSTIGNFEPHEASAFLTRVGKMLGPKCTLIVGVDLVKDPAILNAAYNDKAGVTAAFNLNLIARINRELGARLDVKSFQHHAFFNRERRRIEMHLASVKRQRVKVAGESIEFRVGETIHTENSYKYTLESFRGLVRGAGWIPTAVWTDENDYFSVQVLSREEDDEPPREDDDAAKEQAR